MGIAGRVDQRETDGDVLAPISEEKAGKSENIGVVRIAAKRPPREIDTGPLSRLGLFRPAIDLDRAAVASVSWPSPTRRANPIIRPGYGAATDCKRRLAPLTQSSTCDFSAGSTCTPGWYFWHQDGCLGGCAG